MKVTVNNVPAPSLAMVLDSTGSDGFFRIIQVKIFSSEVVRVKMTFRDGLLSHPRTARW